MPKYKNISVLFKEKNNDVYDWVVKQSDNEDISMSAFILRLLKKVKYLEDENAKETIN